MVQICRKRFRPPLSIDYNQQKIPWNYASGSFIFLPRHAKPGKVGIFEPTRGHFSLYFDEHRTRFS
jgi:hypothetical protein